MPQCGAQPANAAAARRCPAAGARAPGGAPGLRPGSQRPGAGTAARARVQTNCCRPTPAAAQAATQPGPVKKRPARSLKRCGRQQNTRLLADRKALFLAPALIAAKPVKPCDGGVFGAVFLLLKKEHKERNPKRRSRRYLAANVCSLPFVRAAWLRFGGTVAHKARKPCGGPEFAIGLIAAKSLKPCDRAFF